jgi:hypothetical protein
VGRDVTSAVGNQSPLSTAGGRFAENSLTRRYLDSPAGSSAGRLAALARDSDLLRTGYGENFLDRPVFLEADQHALLDRDLEALRVLLASLPDRLFGGDAAAMATACGMAPVQVEAAMRSRTGEPFELGRADLYHDGERFQMLEFNIGSALGGFENAEINRALLADPAVAEFVAAEQLDYVDTLRCYVETMLAQCPAIDLSAKPVMAIVDWPSSFVTLEKRLGYMAALMKPYGIEALPCHIGQLEEKNGHLYLDGRHLDIVYRFFLIEDLLDGPEAPGLVDRILTAAERGTVQFFSRFLTEVHGNKGALAMASDQRNRSLFDDEELRVVDSLLPWTRFVRDEDVSVGDEDVPLLDYVMAEQRSLLIKPTLMHGAIGVVPGWEVEPDVWRERTAEALDGPYVVQRRVRPAIERAPVAGEPGRFRPVVFNWGVFVTATGYGGAIVRGSAQPDIGVVSMSHGAEVGCCFHARSRT